MTETKIVCKNVWNPLSFNHIVIKLGYNIDLCQKKYIILGDGRRPFQSEGVGGWAGVWDQDFSRILPLVKLVTVAIIVLGFFLDFGKRSLGQ